jgi:DNA-binding LacI/PurR family transcriptional regulator
MLDDREQGRRAVKPTAKAVAARAGVSVTTVSRVINNRADDISPETRARVLKAAKALRYRPNSLAAALRKGQSNTVGLIVPDISDAYFHQIARGVDDVASAAGYTILLCNTDRDPEKEKESIRVLYDRSVDAIIFAGGGVNSDRHLSDLPWDQVNVVTVGPHVLPFPNIRVDDAGTIRMAMEHILAQGCTRVLCIAGADSWLISSERARGYREALEAAGIPYDDDLMMSGDFGLESGRAAIDRAIEAGIQFDAVMAFNDYTAAGASSALQKHGRRVPEDVVVVGCDDILLARLVTPALTSVGFPQYSFGTAAMKTALDLIEGRPVEPVTTFDYRLAVRASSRGRSEAIPVPEKNSEEEPSHA